MINQNDAGSEAVKATHVCLRILIKKNCFTVYFVFILYNVFAHKKASFMKPGIG